ncbi:P-loop containing nucleoside triphosphate hydrolase protein, partial [Haematococcus lacustris]
VAAAACALYFQAAKKKAPCIVFIDEIDAIGGNRKHWENHSRKTLNQLLVEMDGFESSEGVIVMAATNLAETLDAALKRPGRFDRQVAVPLPDIQGRIDILDYYLGSKPVAGEVDRDLIARQTQGETLEPGGRSP